MKCKKVSSLMSDYLDGQLPISTRTELEMHLSHCESCFAEMDRLKLMLSDMKSLSCGESGLDCWPAVRSRILNEQTVRERRFWKWLLRPSALGPAFAALALAIGLIFGPGKPAEDVQAEPSAAMEYRSYISAHSRVQRQQAFNDPDVVFITAQLEKANFSSDFGSK